MAGNWRKEEERKRRRDENTGEDAAAALATVATLAGGAYLIYKGFEWLTSSSKQGEQSGTAEQQQQEQRHPSTFHQSLSQPVYQRDTFNLSEDEHEENISIAVDATKERAGGFLLLPRSKQIYFYSIDWAHIFSFPAEPDKFEMVNTLLALEIFEDYVGAYRRKYPEEGTLCVKTDNTFCTNPNPARTYPGERNSDYRNLFTTIDAQLKSAPFWGKWEYVRELRSDIHLKIADRLSRGNYSESPYIQHPAYQPDPFPEYTEVNISESDYAVLHTVALHVPSTLKR